MKKLNLIITLFIIFTTAGCQAPANTDVQASGIIEAVEVSISSEISGRVLEVNTSTGDSVNAGDVLLVLDDNLLQSQKFVALAELDAASASVQTAQSAVEAAQAQYNQILSLAQAQDAASFTWDGTKPTEFDQPIWYFSKEEKLQSAQNELELAKISLDEALKRLSDIEKSAGSANFLEIERNLSNSRISYEVAQVVYDSTIGVSEGSYLQDEAQTALDIAENNLNTAQQEYEDGVTTNGARDVLNARANVEVTRQRYIVALSTIRDLQTGEDSLSVVAQSKVVDQAKAALLQVQLSVSAAKANIDLIDTQLEMHRILAPTGGTILVSSVQPGEVIQAGMPLLKIGKLDNLKVVVYIPEPDYGKIKLGQQVNMSVDSFPDETFHASVTRIADQAEFTPLNVQTKEGRQTTVYAIELSVDNPDGKLKPGMPVDVVFENTGSG